MSTFGSKVNEFLGRIGKDAAWLAVETGITPGAISKWLSNPKRIPKPASVKKVAVAFKRAGFSQEEIDEIFEAAEMTIRPSRDLDELDERRLAFYRSNPRAAKLLSRIESWSVEAQDQLFSMNEAYIEMIERQERQKATRRRTTPKEPQ